MSKTIQETKQYECGCIYVGSDNRYEPIILCAKCAEKNIESGKFWK